MWPCQLRPEPDQPPLPIYDIHQVPREIDSGSNETNPKHRCLCGALHVLTGTKIWMVFTILFVAPFLRFDVPTQCVDVPHAKVFCSSIDLLHKRVESQTNILGFQLQYLASIFCGLLALIFAQKMLLWPYLINSVFIFGYFLHQSCEGAYSLIRIVVHQYETNKRLVLSDSMWTLIVAEFFLLAAVFVSSWQMSTLFKCKRYFADKKSAKILQQGMTVFVQQLNQVHKGADSPPPYDSKTPPPFFKEQRILA